jgi:hypothetical protein
VACGGSSESAEKRGGGDSGAGGEHLIMYKWDSCWRRGFVQIVGSSSMYSPWYEAQDKSLTSSKDSFTPGKDTLKLAITHSHVVCWISLKSHTSRLDMQKSFSLEIDIRV